MRKKQRGAVALPLPQVLTFLGRDRNWFNHYFSTLGCLRTKYRDPEGGRARHLSEENILELAFLAEIGRGEINIMVALNLVSGWLEDISKNRLGQFFIFVQGSAGMIAESDKAHLDSKSSIHAAALAIKPQINLAGSAYDDVMPKEALSFKAINLAEIARRVNAFVKVYSEDSTDAE